MNILLITLIYSLMMVFNCIAFDILWKDESQKQIAVIFVCHCIVMILKRILPSFIHNMYINEYIFLAAETICYFSISLATVMGLNYIKAIINDKFFSKICIGFVLFLGIMVFISLMAQIFHVINGLFYILLGILTCVTIPTFITFLILRRDRISLRNKWVLIGFISIIITFVGAVVLEKFNINSLTVGLSGMLIYFFISQSIILNGIYILKYPRKPTPKIKAEDVLSQAEFAVFEQMRDTDMRNTEIADELGLSLNTVKTHIRHIYKKLEVCNRDELTKIY